MKLKKREQRYFYIKLRHNGNKSESKKNNFTVIENQIKKNDPPETKKALKILKSQGYSEFESKQLIGQCVAVEIYNMLKYKKPYDNERYNRNLNNLPEEPFE